MSERFNSIIQALRTSVTHGLSGLRFARRFIIPPLASGVHRNRNLIITLAVLGTLGYLLVKHPPLQTMGRSELGVRLNNLTGGTEEFRDGVVMVIPGLHELRRYSLLDQTYRPVRSSKANGDAPFQSVEGLSLGVDLNIRYALDVHRISAMSKKLPADINGEIVEPVVQGVIYKAFTRYTVREIFSSKRQEIMTSIETELKPKLAADGILLRSVTIGKIDLPADYKNGMDKLLAEELETEKMRFTLELKEKQVRQTALEAEAEKIKQETNAQAAANVTIIAAKAQEEAMKHVLPFKQKQIEQRKLEAEADKGSRITTAEGAAQARRIEAAGEADSRRKLADAETYRLEILGKVASAQLERDGALITKHPLLIQKTMADKLSDKISVIIAPPSLSGGFIGANLLGNGQPNKAPRANQGEGNNEGSQE